MKQEGGDGLVLGYHAAFKVTAPSGWIFDNESSEYTPAVIYPNGKSWEGNDAPVISNDIHRKYGSTLEETLLRLRSGNSGPSPTELPTLATTDGRVARVQQVEKFQRVAYVDVPEAYCEISLSAPDQASFDKALPAFEEVVKSFRFFGPDSGEYLASSGVRNLLRRTTEARDLLLYAPPEGWTKELDNPEVRIYRRVKDKTYGLLGVYPRWSSNGSPEADYELAWNELVRSAFGVGSAPAPQSRVQDGCQVKVGQAVVKMGDQQTTVMLAVFTGGGRSTSFLASFNDSSFLADIQSVLNSCHAYYTVTGGLGQWSAGVGGTQAYVDGRWVQLAEDGFASRRYAFTESSYQFQGEAKLPSGHYILLNESGTYTVSGNHLNMVGQGGTHRELDRDGKPISSRALPPWSRTYTYKMVDIKEAVHGPYLILRGVEENSLDGGYEDFFPNSFIYVRGYHPEWRFQRF